MWSIFLAILSLDRLSKYFVSQNILLNQSLPVIKNIFHLTLIHNTGAAFGIFKNHNYLFIFISILAILFIYLQSRKEKSTEMILKVSLALISSGTIGNLIDRIYFGYVIDFLDLRIWPVFNIADSSITVGAILLAYSILKSKNQKSKNFEF
jgi:signal peptidase II